MVNFTPAASSEFRTTSPVASRPTTGSITTSAFVTPRSARSIPTSRVTPTPYRTLDVAISNAISRCCTLWLTIPSGYVGRPFQGRRGGAESPALLLEFRVELTHEPIAGGSRLLNLRVEIRCRLRGHDLLLCLALADHGRHLIPNRHNHVAMRGDRRPIDDGTVSRHDLRVRSGVRDHGVQRVDQTRQRAAVGAVDVRELNGAIEVAGHDHVGVHEFDECIAVRVGLRRGNQPDLLA